MAEPIFSLAQKKKTLLAAHRGVSGGNIPCNSKPAFELALRTLFARNRQTHIDDRPYGTHGISDTDGNQEETIWNSPSGLRKKPMT